MPPVYIEIAKQQSMSKSLRCKPDILSRCFRRCAFIQAINPHSFSQTSEIIPIRQHSLEQATAQISLQILPKAEG